MSTLHVRNIPDDLYERVRKLADREKRSLTTEVIDLLDHAVRDRESREGTGILLARIARRARKTKFPAGWVDSVDLLREDRDR